ncbi:hypothetical protein [Streptomyces sp. NPDC001815]|uniref:hypothetical protein n=1 Tax=Streptomyces sp. NPDC001815 TaxID=3154526 RepID=UPI003330197C
MPTRPLAAMERLRITLDHITAEAARRGVISIDGVRRIARQSGMASDTGPSVAEQETP